MSLIEQIAAAGVVGCGGAGFPTHVKLKGTISHYILNAVECEPLLRTDRYILVHLARQVVQAASAVRRELGNIPCTIAIKADYREEIASLNAAIAALDPEIRLHKLSSFYPAGDEQSLVAEVSGKNGAARRHSPGCGLRGQQCRNDAVRLRRHERHAVYP